MLGRNKFYLGTLTLEPDPGEQHKAIANLPPLAFRFRKGLGRASKAPILTTLDGIVVGNLTLPCEQLSSAKNEKMAREVQVVPCHLDA